MKDTCPKCYKYAESNGQSATGTLYFKCKCGNAWMKLSGQELNIIKQEE